MANSTASHLGIAALLVLSLSACAAEDDKSSLTLADSKAPAQLLRNEVRSQLPADAVNYIVEISDKSVACGEEKEVEAGLMRSWRSTANVMLTAEASTRADQLVDELTEWYVSQGWTDRSLYGTQSDYDRYLGSPGSLAVVRLTAKHFDEEAETDTTAGALVASNGIEIEVRGPCVKTGGPDSAEVKELEAL